MRYFPLKSPTIILGTIIPLIFWAHILKGQEEKPLKIQALNKKGKVILAEYPHTFSATDSMEARKMAMDLVKTLQNEGYLQAKLHGFFEKPAHFLAIVDTGGKDYEFALEQGNLPDSLIKAAGLGEGLFKPGPFNKKGLDRKLDQVVTYAENHGYPFASIQLQDIAIREGRVMAKLHYEAGLFITFDEIKLEGTNKVKSSFIQNYLGIKTGAPFDQRLVNRIENRLSRLNFISIKEKPEVYFRNEMAQVIISLAVRKNNQVDGLISLLPNQGSDRGIMVAGELDIGLTNLFRSGKSLDLHWERPQSASQELNVDYGHPQLFGLPVKAMVDFQLLKQDTLFLNREGQLRFAFLQGKKSEIAIHTGFKTGNQLGEVETINEPYGNYQLNTYGLEYRWFNLDSRQFPAKGNAFFISGSGGKKVIDHVKKDEQAPQNWQFYLNGGFRHYYSLNKQLILFHRIQGGYIEHPQLFLNDLFRLGGFDNLRGFNENEFYASSYLLSNFECRLVFETINRARSYIYLFYDQGYYHQNLQEEKYKDYPGGFGAGLNLITKAGTFNLAYALGKNKLQPVNFSRAKIHVGYKTKF